MVAKSSPDWLPAGWSVQFRAQNRIYTDLETGKKFFSKDDVIRYTKKATNRGEEPQRINTKNPSDRSHSQLAANTDEYPEWLPDGWKVELRTSKTGIQVGREYKVVVEKHNVEDLPPGWILEVKVRKVANRIRRDPYYTDPVHGYVFRSKKEVIRYLQTGETSKHTIKPKSMGTNDLKLTDDEIAWPRTLQETENSKLQDKRPTESICALAPVTEVILEKHFTENLVEECVETKETVPQDGHHNQKAEPSSKPRRQKVITTASCTLTKREAKRSKLQDKRVTDDSKVALAPTAEAVPHEHLNDPALTPAANTLNKNSHMSRMERRNTRRSQIDARKSKQKEKLNLLRRSSKRLAGLEPEPVNSLVSTVQALQVTTRKSSKGDGSRGCRLALDDFVNRASQQLGDASETEVAHHTITGIISTVQGEPLSKIKRPFDGLEVQPVDTMVSNEQTLHVATRKSSRADTVQKENTLDIGRCSRKPRAISNKSKKAKELKVTSSDFKSGWLGLNLSCWPNLCPVKEFEAGQENKVAHDLCTVINPSIHEESLNKIEKSLKDEPVPEEKPLELEIEKAAVENPVSQFSFPFLDTWSDPCLDFAFKTLTGEIPIEDDLFQGYFQENLVTSHNQRDSLALPDFGSPNVFQSDISPQFDAPEQSVSPNCFP
ncbi:hypothetical protein J5N97_001913 [Dioscorea zingiberensis]|uniref:MBD domain-containing protein n=1 Tax=Dioscorea zingiberensis TaxID=325984 RepID=A0A9D5H1Z1_9LILI|nr:hypothetical protein J5N97_001913 [Dioscorea zingiberensis]